MPVLGLTPLHPLFPTPADMVLDLAPDMEPVDMVRADMEHLDIARSDIQVDMV